MTPQEVLEVQENLADAKKQYHLLVTGQAAAVFVDQNGERVEFRPASAHKLRSYIRELEQKLGSSQRPSGPMQVLM